MECTIDHVVDTLKGACPKRKACLLVGAGCSVEAGIPVASGFVDRIKVKHPHKYELADPKTYPYCMKQLHPDEQRELIAEFVDNAKINWAHVCMALLIQNGYVDRILTTNFDPLVVRACALLNIFPAVFDFAASDVFRPAYIAGDAVFHLHGQRSGFVMLNTRDELERQKPRLKPVFDDAGRGRIWIVVGYSGDSDPVFENLANVEEFGGGLYWIGYEDNPPGKHVHEKLLSDEGKRAFLVTGFDADRFFIELARRLGIFPPALVSAPFTHLEGCLDMLTEFRITTEAGQQDVLDSARLKIKKAKELLESPKDHVSEAVQLLMAGNYESVTVLQSEIGSFPELAGLVALAFVAWGTQLTDRARKSTGSDADGLFAQAVEKYKEALLIKHDVHDALNGWGVALSAWARTKSEAEADTLFRQACEKYEAAVKSKPDLHQALNNWGLALSYWGETKSGWEADGLFREACGKFEAALKIRIDVHEVLYNWGNALSSWAKTKSGVEADGLFREACAKYEEALMIKPDKYGALNNLGITLSDWAKTKSGGAADEMFGQACERCAAALRIKPDMPEALNNWAYALSAWASTKSAAVADEMFEQACEKCAAALRIKPDLHQALDNWGIALTGWAKTKSGAEADGLFEQACEKHKAALKIRPDMHGTMCNWGGALLEWAKTKSGAEADGLFQQAVDKYETALKIKPNMHEALNNLGATLSSWAETKSGAEADELYRQACEKYEAALRVAPESDIELNGWAGTLLYWARNKTGIEVQKLYMQAEEKARSAERLREGSAAYNLACISALRGLADECRHWLEKARDAGTLPKIGHLKTDTDLDSVRDKAWFKEFLAGLEKGQAKA